MVRRRLERPKSGTGRGMYSATLGVSVMPRGRATHMLELRPANAARLYSDPKPSGLS